MLLEFHKLYRRYGFGPYWKTELGPLKNCGYIKESTVKQNFKDYIQELKESKKAAKLYMKEPLYSAAATTQYKRCDAKLQELKNYKIKKIKVTLRVAS